MTYEKLERKYWLQGAALGGCRWALKCCREHRDRLVLERNLLRAQLEVAQADLAVARKEQK